MHNIESGKAVKTCRAVVNLMGKSGDRVMSCVQSRVLQAKAPEVWSQLRGNCCDSLAFEAVVQKAAML